MVGGGSDGSLDLCARVCIIDEQENILFHSYVKPPIPVTNYRFGTHNYKLYGILKFVIIYIVERCTKGGG